jgi:hypothetical protein
MKSIFQAKMSIVRTIGALVVGISTLAISAPMAFGIIVPVADRCYLTRCHDNGNGTTTCTTTQVPCS